MALDFETLDQFVSKVENFFEKNFKIKFSSEYLMTVMESSVILLSPYDEYSFKVEDLKKIEDFFEKELKMNGYGLERKIKNIKNKSHGFFSIEFYYYMGFTVTIRFIYFKNGDEKLFMLGYIKIYKEGERVKEVIMAKVESDMKELERLMKNAEDDSEDYDGEDEEYDNEDFDEEDYDDYEEEEYDDYDEEYDDEEYDE